MYKQCIPLHNLRSKLIMLRLTIKPYSNVLDSFLIVLVLILRATGRMTVYINPWVMGHDRPLRLKRPSTIVLTVHFGSNVCPVWLKTVHFGQIVYFTRPSTLRTVYFHSFWPPTLDQTPKMSHRLVMFQSFRRIVKGFRVYANTLTHLVIDNKFIIGWIRFSVLSVVKKRLKIANRNQPIFVDPNRFQKSFK